MYLKVGKRVLHRSLTGGRAEMRENSGTAQLISAAGAPRHSGSRCLLALVTPLLWPSSSVLYTELAPQQSTTTARTSCSTVLQSSEDPARSTAELAVVGVVVGTKAHLSAIHRRSFPSLKAGYTVDAHIEALVDERDVASSFVPGHCSRRKAPYTAKYISLHLSYRRPGVQPPPVRLSSTLAPAK